MDESSANLPHAPSAVNVVAVLGGVGIMVAGIVLAIGGAWIMASFVPSPLFAPNNAQRPEIAGPVQRTAPSQEREAFFGEKNRRLHGRGADRDTGEAFLPIEEAMKAMAVQAPEKGKGAR